MKLFEDKNRIHEKPATHNENTYDYYDGSAKDNVSIMRNKLNEWFYNYPENERKELKSRFKKTFSSAFYELFLFELFRQQGFKIKIHPTLPNTNKCPDFLISKDNFEMYVEAKEARDKTSEKEANEHRINQVYDSLNKIKTKNYFLYIRELKLKSDKQPAIKKYIKLIEEKLKEFNPDEVTRLIEVNGFNESPWIQIDNDDIFVKLSLIPKDYDKRDSYCRTIGVYPMTSSWGGSDDAIKKSFFKKAKRYGILDKPYLICINTSSSIAVDYDINNAIWGMTALRNDDKLVRMPNGMFNGKNGPTCKNVSGVLITNVMEFNIAVSEYWFAKNPYTTNELDFNYFELSYQYVKDNKICIENGKKISEIINIKKDWIKI